MKNTMNNRRIYFNSKSFSTTSFLQSEKFYKLMKELDEFKDSKNVLENDLGLIADAVRAASKITTGEKLLKREEKVLNDLKSDYHSFFDSEGEEENSSSLLNKVMGLKRYLKSEAKTAKNNISKLEEELSDPKWRKPMRHVGESSNRPVIETGESSKSNKRPLGEEEESSKKPRLESEDSSNQTPGNYIDTLPDLPYNPFDDIGTD